MALRDYGRLSTHLSIDLKPGLDPGHAIAGADKHWSAKVPPTRHSCNTLTIYNSYCR